MASQPRAAARYCLECLNASAPNLAVGVDYVECGRYRIDVGAAVLQRVRNVLHQRIVDTHWQRRRCVNTEIILYAAYAQRIGLRYTFGKSAAECLYEYA